MLKRQSCRERINISSFGATESQRKQVDTVPLQLETISGGTLNITALVIPHLTTSMKNYVDAAVMNYPYLRTLPLANNTNSGVFWN